MIGRKWAVPAGNGVNASEFFVSYFLSSCRLPGHDKNVIRLKDLDGEYLQSYMVNQLDCEAGVENVVMQAAVL